MTQAPPPADLKMQRSSRDATTLPTRLAEWLSTVLPEGADPVVTLHSGIDANGMSSETIVLDVDWTEGGEAKHGEYVARVAPAAHDLPVFAHYELQDQYDAMRIVAEQTVVPVPAVRWIEPTGEVLGTPFFLMDRIDGIVPQDVLPYNFGDNWLFDASREDQRRLQDNSARVLAQLHAIPDAAATFDFLDPPATATPVTPCSSATSPAPRSGTSSPSPTSAARRWSSARSRGSRPTCRARTRPCCAGATPASAT